MRERDKKNEPHVGDSSFGVDDRLDRKRKDDGGPKAGALVRNSPAPCEDRQCNERRRDDRWKTRREIILSKDFEARHLGPVGEGRFVEAILVVEIRNDVIATLDHFA